MTKFEEKYRWKDPNTDVIGVLLSDQIVYYVEKTKLIESDDWEETKNDLLRPASYTLRVGKEYWIEGKTKTLKEGEKIVIPPCGLVYVRIYEKLNVPYYMIARLNLRVKQVYRGLLLGTGPQVEPGFKGTLNCPIHNLTHEPKELNYKEELGTIDFIKTSLFGKKEFWTTGDGKDILTEKDLLNIEVKGINDYPCLLFAARDPRLLELDRPLKDYLPCGESVKSGLRDTVSRISQLERTTRRWRNIALASILGAALLIIISVFTWILDWDHYVASVFLKDFKSEISEIDTKIGENTSELAQIEKRIKQLEQKTAALPSQEEKQSKP